MRKTITITYPATPARTAQMLADPAYQEARVSRAGLDNASVDVAQRGQGFVATIAGSIQPSQLPSVASRFVRSAVSFSVAESWGEGNGHGGPSRDGRGAPGRRLARRALSRPSIAHLDRPRRSRTVRCVAQRRYSRDAPLSASGASRGCTPVPPPGLARFHGTIRP